MNPLAAKLPVLKVWLVVPACFILSLLLVNCQQRGSSEDSSRQPPPVTAESREAVLSPAPSATATQEALPATVPATDEPVAETEAPSTKPTEQATLTPERTIEDPGSKAEPEPTIAMVEWPEGALISVMMEGQVGVLLGELPEEMRDRVAGDLLDRDQDYWRDLAQRQVRLTKRRLNFRNFIYPTKGQLPLPPEELWTIQVDPNGPQRLTIQGHDLVVTNYIFSSTLLTDAESAGRAEPALREPGGIWNEPYVLPADPDLLLQRTGNACLNEAGFPPNSFDSENAWVFYDYSCEGTDGGIFACHRTRLHPQSCVEELEDRVGTIEAAMRFERLEWDPDLADQVRMGELTHVEGPDLSVVGDDLAINRVIYRYFPEDSCALAEQCVSGSGWRRLLQFNGTVHNVGAVTMGIGPVVASNPLSNLFQYNSCHAHYHFSDYGDFTFTGEEENLASKQAFCVESTNRLSNNEYSPLIHDYTCSSQGVQAGWVDEYVAGLDCQWIDITDIEVEPEGSTFSLGFHSNPDEFLCEGIPVVDEEGNPIWEPSELTRPDGTLVNRPLCDFVPDWDVNNDESREVTLLPVGTFVTEPCVNDLLGPLRNCDFLPQVAGIEMPLLEEPADAASDAETVADNQGAAVPEGAFACEPGRPVALTCSVENERAPQVLRLCEFSAALGAGVGCSFREALANKIVGSEEVNLTFTCPFVRDEQEPGGLFALYTAPAAQGDERQPIACQAGN